jgi:hypothetical protein
MLLKFQFDASWYVAVMVRNMPPGWPQDVQPPGSEGWEATAVTFPVKFICSATERASCSRVTPAQLLPSRDRPDLRPAGDRGGPVVAPKRSEAMVRFLDGTWRLCKVNEITRVSVRIRPAIWYGMGRSLPDSRSSALPVP